MLPNTRWAPTLFPEVLCLPEILPGKCYEDPCEFCADAAVIVNACNSLICSGDRRKIQKTLRHGNCLLPEPYYEHPSRETLFKCHIEANDGTVISILCDLASLNCAANVMLTEHERGSRQVFSSWSFLTANGLGSHAPFRGVDDNTHVFGVGGGDYDPVNAAICIDTYMRTLRKVFFVASTSYNN